MVDAVSDKPLSSDLEIALDLSALTAAYAIARPLMTGQNAIIALAGCDFLFMTSKEGLTSEIRVEFECLMGTTPAEKQVFRTQVSLFERYLCNARMWRADRKRPSFKVVFRFPSAALEPAAENDGAEIRVDIRCVNLEISWLLLRSSSNFMINEQIGERCSHLQEFAQALSIAAEVVDSKADDRYRVVESRNMAVLSGSQQGAREVSGIGVPDLAIRADHKYVDLVCTLLKKMDVSSTTMWRAGDDQHFADDKVHFAFSQMMTDLPPIEQFFKNEPMTMFDVGAHSFSEAVRRIVAQAADDQSSIALLVTLGAKPTLQFETRVRGGTATVTLDISDPTVPEVESEFRASLLVQALERLYPALSLTKQSTHLALFEHAVVLTVEIDQLVVKSLLTFVEGTNVGRGVDQIGAKRNKTIRPKWLTATKLDLTESET